jgi:hypothetical protein
MLKDLSREKFESAFANAYNTAEVTKGIEEVYTSTPSRNRGLQDTAINGAAHQGDDLFRYKGFEHTMDRISEFRKDMTKRLSTMTSKKDRVIMPIICHLCKIYFNTKRRGDSGSVHCLSCSFINIE